MWIPRKSEKKEKCRVIVCIFIRVYSDLWDEISQNRFLKALLVNSIAIGIFFATIFFIFREFGVAVKSHKLSSHTLSQCSPGFFFENRKCFDINECEQNSCQHCPSQICQNLIGSFKCKNPKCPIGYRIHASYRRTHVNKCVRKRCRRKDANCYRQPKYRSFKTFHISPTSDVRNYGGLVMHEIYTRKYIDGIVVDMKVDSGEACVRRESLELRLIKVGKLILILRNHADLIEKCTNETKLVEIRFKSTFNEQIIESLDVKLKFFK